MRLVQEEPMQTVHVYVVPEDQLPPKRNFTNSIAPPLCFLCLLGILLISLLSVKPNQDVSFTVAIKGYALAPVANTMKLTVRATGKVTVPASFAKGSITFYNGEIYTQIIPTGTVLKGFDGVSIITDAQAVIPPAAQTTPPTYGQVAVAAHALLAGVSGNIPAGDINEACCVTSVIAQNPYRFRGGRDAYTYTYLTNQDVKTALYPFTSEAQQQALSRFPTTLVLDPTCTTTIFAHPSIGVQTNTATVTLTVTCQAVSFHETALRRSIATYEKKLGEGAFTRISYQVVGREGDVIYLYVTAQVSPEVARHVIGK